MKTGKLFIYLIIVTIISIGYGYLSEVVEDRVAEISLKNNGIMLKVIAEEREGEIELYKTMIITKTIIFVNDTIIWYQKIENTGNVIYTSPWETKASFAKRWKFCLTVFNEKKINLKTS